ncbi:MAG: sugar phosphorylase [Planctomycetota bacterium]|jgi:sucrose phosphorylase
MELIWNEVHEKLINRFEKLYPSQSGRCLQRLKMMIGRYSVGGEPVPFVKKWSENDCLLITYADMVQNPQNKDRSHLGQLKHFAEKHLYEKINIIHILPFSPYSSDDGFSVIDYRLVNTDFGDWKDVERLGTSFDLMFDLVLNHVSAKSQWVKDFCNHVLPYREYFIEVDPETDLSEVTRPRAHELLASIKTRDGISHLWATFSHDQIDLDFSNSDVFFEFLDILFYYISKGARLIRLDAIAYLWKKIGTTCIHLEETHEVVKLMRDIIDLVAPQVIILTETNVPHKENISYFGDGDEANMVYQFSLPPLLLHALQTGNSKYLSQWAAGLEQIPAGCTYLNFTASHDGVGVRPLEGIIPPAEVNALAERVKKRGGLVSYKKNTDGTESPYELNVSYFDALAESKEKVTELDIDRFLCSQTIPLALQGIPAIYFHSLTGTRNNYKGVEELGYARAINRMKWDSYTLEKELKDKSTATAKVFDRYLKILDERKKHQAFDPESPQKIIQLSDAFFAVERTAFDESECIISVSNMTGKKQELAAQKILGSYTSGIDVLDGNKKIQSKDKLIFKPYQTSWIVAK